MTKFIILFYLILLCCSSIIHASGNLDYTIYHQQIVLAETLIASEKYEAALQVYETLFNEYKFVFLRDYQIATQLALLLNEEQRAKTFLINGIKSGWTIKSIRKNRFLDELRKNEDWKSIKKQYRNLNEKYQSSLNQNLKKSVKKMFSKDQQKAFGALFRFRPKVRDRYAEEKFAPHSEKQITAFLLIFNEYGYPGEQLIGNDFWMSTIISHHNSISTNYNNKDTLYPSIRPKLKRALKSGQISAFEFAIIDEWYRAIIKDENKPTYGIIEGLRQSDLEKTNELRKTVYLRPIEVHNKLVDIEEKTGMNFYLDGYPWEAGKIEIR